MSRTLSTLCLIILAITSFGQKLSKDEKKIVASVDQRMAEAIAFLEKVVNINSGTNNLKGVQAVEKKKGIRRYGHAYVPLDEALSRVVIDLSGRPGLVLNADFTRGRIGDFDVDLISEFFQGFVNHALVTLHIDNLTGKNAHHQAETIFKAFGRALRMAIEHDPAATGIIPSTKGTL